MATAGTNKLSLLIDGMSKGDSEVVTGLIAELSVRELDTLIEVNAKNRYMTPLHFATINNKLDVVKLLLSKGVDIARGEGCYSNFYGYFIWKETPLLSALCHGKPISLIQTLLEHGADPQYDENQARMLDPRIGRMHGSYPIQIPFNVALIKGRYIFELILRYSDVQRTFGSGQHTCLCYAIKHYLEVSCSSLTIEFIRMILQRGGVLCNGSCNNFAEEAGIISSDGRCSIVIKCLHAIITDDIDSLHGFHCTSSKAAMKCLELVCTSDYLRTGSCLFQTLETFRNYRLRGHGDDGVDHAGERNQLSDVVMHKLRWIQSFTQQPSTLKHICRVWVKRLIPNITREIVLDLPIPEELMAYLNNEP
ncbi:uncharacterized protein LOC127834086 isoform X1 [Dreissena polymorpha]|uniref:SOCS box domain-containing protein n=1 Tax=Dreissena polymorpha TaxID=45954 RepID=A0A9D4GDM2_DREPO|nr:uncharacterized protein LOC127834086 isoform X1 [Dreissena polymorpha]KAH3815229.1 hypothetical protein DPMN_143752 [Dreissena polymorpha]